jgi:hypothetical protein
VPEPTHTLAERLAALVVEVAGDLDLIDVNSAGTAVEYRTRGRLFAVVDGGVLEVDLGPSIASAAIRTTDTRQSDRGAQWVRFAPRLLDRFGSDRVRAWFEAAWRRANGLSPSAG